MTIIDKINKMRGKEVQEPEILQRLREEGFSPKEIDEGLDQSNVKAAVGTYEDLSSPNIPPPGYPQMTEQYSQQNTSLNPTFNPQFAEHTNQDQIDFDEQQIMSPQSSQQNPQTAYGNQQNPQPLQTNEQYPGQEGYDQEQTQTGYEQQIPQYEYNYNQQFNTDNVTELTEQIIEEKTQEMQKTITDLSKFKLEIQGKIQGVEDRLRRIEITIDKLQASIIGQIGNYGQNISDLKQEMIATQESFSKIINPLTSNIQELRELTSQIPKPESETKETPKKTTTTKTSKSKKSKDGFDNYLRS